MIVTGLLLQVKKELAWVQPPTQSGSGKNETPAQDWASILKAVQGIEPAGVTGWKDIDRLDVRPGKGIVKVRAANHWEVQLDLQTGEVLSSTYRRSDLIESLHDGSFFQERAKLWVFLPSGLILLGLWLSGLWLWYLPLGAKKRSRQKAGKGPSPNVR